MPLSLALTGSNIRWALARAMAPKTPIAANDDTSGAQDSAAILDAALRHFAVHGLGSARAACQEAEAALAADDRAGAEHWRDVCRALDKRAAAGLDRRLGRSLGQTTERHHSSR